MATSINTDNGACLKLQGLILLSMNTLFLALLTQQSLFLYFFSHYMLLLENSTLCLHEWWVHCYARLKKKKVRSNSEQSDPNFKKIEETDYLQMTK